MKVQYCFIKILGSHVTEANAVSLVRVGVGGEREEYLGVMLVLEIVVPS